MVQGLATHGNFNWSLFTLLRVAFVWAVGEETELTRRFSAAHDAAVRLDWQRLDADTYNGFLKALHRWTPTFRERLTQHFRRQMQILRGGHDRLWGCLQPSGTT